jgi:hypothetical protein
MIGDAPLQSTLVGYRRFAKLGIPAPSGFG